jgi:hypothetical protein
MGKKKENLIDIEVDLDKETLFNLSMIAHDQDITLNQLCNNILKAQIKLEEKKND